MLLVADALKQRAMTPLGCSLHLAVTVWAILFLRKTHDDTQATPETFIIDQGDC
jgi:hypothetical protein